MDVRASKLFAPHGQVSFLVQALSNGIKGHAFLSMLRDGLIEEQLIVSVVIFGESRGAICDWKVEAYIRKPKYPLTPHKRYCRITYWFHYVKNVIECRYKFFCKVEVLILLNFFEMNSWNVYFNQEIKWWCLRGDCCKKLSNYSHSDSHWPTSQWPNWKQCDEDAIVGILFQILTW